MAALSEKEQRELYDNAKVIALLVTDIQDDAVALDGKGAFATRALASLTRIEQSLKRLEGKVA